MDEGGGNQLLRTSSKSDWLDLSPKVVEEKQTKILATALESNQEPGVVGDMDEGSGNQLSRTSSKSDWLDLSRKVIEEKQTKILARALESNQLPEIKTIFLHHNAGDLGMRALLNAMQLGYLGGLTSLILWGVSSYDQITAAEEGTDAIADSLKEGKMPNLERIDFTGSLPKLIPPRPWMQVLGDLVQKGSWGTGRLRELVENYLCCFCCSNNSGHSKTNQSLNCLRCKVSVYSGDDGTVKIVKALAKFPLQSLKFLHLGHNYIGDDGCTALYSLLKTGALPKLEELDLTNNLIGIRGAEFVVKAYLENPLLTVRVTLDWPTLLLAERASAFRESNIRLEHRLTQLNISGSMDVTDPKFKERFNWEVGYELRRPDLLLSHKFYLQCQRPFEGKVKEDEHKTTRRGEGIAIGRRSCFANSYRKFVHRELQEVDEEKATEENLSEIATTASAERSSVRSTPPLDPIPVPGPDSVSHLMRRKKPLTRHMAKNHIYISAGSCGFIGAAKALGTQSTKGIWRSGYSFARKVFQNKERTREHIQSITEELLMLADRKPPEFREMFLLRRVILRDTSASDKPVYYPAYICDECFEDLGSAPNKYVQPVVEDALLECRPPLFRTSPSPSPSNSERTKPAGPFARQQSRLKESVSARDSTTDEITAVPAEISPRPATSPIPEP